MARFFPHRRWCPLMLARVDAYAIRRTLGFAFAANVHDFGPVEVFISYSKEVGQVVFRSCLAARVPGTMCNHPADLLGAAQRHGARYARSPGKSAGVGTMLIQRNPHVRVFPDRLHSFGLVA